MHKNKVPSLPTKGYILTNVDHFYPQNWKKDKWKENWIMVVINMKPVFTPMILFVITWFVGYTDYPN